MKYVFQHIFRIDPVQRKGWRGGGGEKSKRSSLAFPIGLMRSFLRCGDSLGNSNGSFSTLLPLPSPGFRQIIAECERNKLGVSGESVNDRIGSLICIKIFVILFLTWISIGNNSFFLPFFFSFDFSSINAMEIGRAWSSVSISRKNFSLWFLSRILGGIPHKEQCGFEFLQGTRIVNHGRYFLYGESKMRSSFIRSVYLLCRFVKIAVQRHGYLNLHEAFPFPSEYSVNTSYIYIDKKRCFLDRVSVLSSFFEYVYSLSSVRFEKRCMKAFFVRIIRDGFKWRKYLELIEDFSLDRRNLFHPR